MRGDFEVWLALHEDCGPYGCGVCVVVDLDLEEELITGVKDLAQRRGVPYDAMLMECIETGMEMCFGSRWV